jgi:predicted dehydrogenase
MEPVTSQDPVGVGIIGAGYISTIYLENCTRRFDTLRVVGIADLMMDRARDQASPFGIAAMTVDELLAHPDIEIVVNLTIPAAHGEVGMQAVEAGKSVYNEKPLATTPAAARQLLERAAERGVRVGAAPDTFLGGGLQTVRALLDEGAIGRPVAVTGMMLTAGHERWHPNPDFYYQPGGGPLWDMGPYYLTALLSLLGPVERVAATASASYDTRTIKSGPRAGESVPVDTPTHILTLLDFASGPRGTLTTSFDVHDTRGSTLVLYGSEGTLRLPDPNTFGGPIELLRAGGDTWETIEPRYPNTDNSRGLGVSDMARALREGGPHRASGEMAAHVVDVMDAALRSSEEGRHITVTSAFERPDPLPLAPASARPE